MDVIPTLALFSTEGIEEELVSVNLAVALLLTIAVLGYVSDVVNIWLVVQCPTLHNGFGFLCVSHSVAGILSLSVSCCWTLLVVLWRPDLADSFVSRRFGQAAVALCFLTFYTVLAKAANRFTAILMPFRHRHLISAKATRVVIVVTWVGGIVHGVPFSFGECDFLLHPLQIVWYFSDSKCGQFMAFYVDFLLSCSIMAIVVLLDLVTLFSLIRFVKSNHVAGPLSHRYDVRFFFQSCITSLLQFLMLVSFHVVSRFVQSDRNMFLCTTFAWAACYGFDGAVNCAFNVLHLAHKTGKEFSDRHATTMVIPVQSRRVVSVQTFLHKNSQTIC